MKKHLILLICFVVFLVPVFAEENISSNIMKEINQRELIAIMQKYEGPIKFLKIISNSAAYLEYNNVNAGLVIKNQSKKPIIGLCGTFLMYDKMGHPVTWGGGSSHFNFMSQDENIFSDQIDHIGYWTSPL